jgi:hypothetical protein
MEETYLRYRRADCDSLAKGIDIASTNLEYRREYLKNILNLYKEKFATNTDVVLAELEVELEEKSLADARRRTSICRDEMAGAETNVPARDAAVKPDVPSSGDDVGKKYGKVAAGADTMIYELD